MSQIGRLQVESLKDACIRKLEGSILSGELAIGEKLPPERQLAAELDISRPVLHEALVDLAAKGLVTITPRRGVRVNDYLRTGSCAILTSLLAYNGGKLDPSLVASLIEMRQPVETEVASLAAQRCTGEQIAELRGLLSQEAAADRGDAARLTELDFDFHLLLAIASGNRMYPLIMNSFKSVYTLLTGTFFRKAEGGPLVDEVHAFHERLVTAIAERDATAARAIAHAMLAHGEKHL